MSVAQLAPAPARDEAAGATLTRIRRALPEAFIAWLGALPGDAWPDGRFLAAVDHVGAGLRALFTECGTPDDAMAKWWIDDVVDIAEQFAARAGADVVDVRLEHVSDDACARFHIDNVRLRLVTTYHGPGTEIVPHPFGPQARSLQNQYDGPVDRMPPGEIAIFQGGPGGVVHRSPPISKTGKSRSLLCLNTLSITSPQLWTPGQHP
ncbi:MAG: DUF1826 domain-containing protein [Pseudomonadota bacterium]